MKITEIKIIIFAQYWMQKIGITKFTHRLQINRSNIGNIDKISVKPLSAITDEDAIEVTKIAYKGRWDLPPDEKQLLVLGKQAVRDLFFNHGSFPMSHNFFIFQYLQSKGYALPYLNYSVEELVEAGVYLLEN